MYSHHTYHRANTAIEVYLNDRILVKFVAVTMR
jgi:hypothetical protein